MSAPASAAGGKGGVPAQQAEPAAAGTVPVPDPGFRLRQACSLCHLAELVPVLRLAPTPLATAFAGDREAALAEPELPLDLVRCRACGHVQLAQIVDRYRVFARSLAPHGASPAMVAHLEAFARDLIAEYPSARDALVVDIGCNDGTLLKAFEDAGRRVQGIEPAVDVAGQALARGIRTHAGFFLPGVAERLEEERGRAAYVIAGMAFAEAERPAELLEAVSLILARDGVFAFEVAHLAPLIAHAAFDGITHRVLDYHALAPLVRFFAANDFEMIAVRQTVEGRGRLRGIAQRLGGPHPRDGSVESLLQLEAAAGLGEAAAFVHFAEAVDAAIGRLADRLVGLSARGVRMAGYGAAASATTLLHALVARGLAADTLAYVHDDAPAKAGLFLPGLGLPIRAGQALGETPPDLILILAWQCLDEILPRLDRFRASGGRVLVPFPVLREL